MGGARRGPIAFTDSLTVVAERIAQGKVPAHDRLQRHARRTVGAVDLDSRFEGATFEAKLYELKHQPSGEIRMVLVIPESDRAEGTKMADAYAHALRVTVGKLRDQ